MKQAKNRTIGLLRLREWGSLAFLCLALTFYSPQAQASAPDVPETGSTITGQDFTCIIIYPYCLSTFICCTNPGPIFSGDIQNKQEQWFLDFWDQEMIVRFRQMATMWSQAIMFQARMIGGFIDAQNSSAAQLSLQRLHAETLRDYVPDDALCRFGTLSRSLAASEGSTRRAKIGMSERSQNRQSLNRNSNSANTNDRGREPGKGSDKAGRLANYITTFCDNTDEDLALRAVCTTAATDMQFNRDIDYARTFDNPLTLDLNFAGGNAATRDQTNLFALGSNLYAHDIIANRPNPDELDPTEGSSAVDKWMDYRAIQAKRSVAENSFNTIAAMKTQGTNSSYSYMRAIMQELGMSSPEIDRTLGTSNPSYYAQMEILTRRLYQNPGFYAHLMQTPSNVLRTQAALGAIGLMQERDIAESMQRSEMLLSTLLELQTTRAQEKLSDKSTR